MERKDLTKEPIVKSIFLLALPIVLGSILQTLYQLTDTFWVGRLGAGAIAAISISFPILFLIISLGIGLTLAGTILVAQYTGKKDKKAVNHVSTQTFILTLVISIVLTIIGYFSSPLLIKFIGAEPAIMSDAISYLQISFLGLIFVFAYLVFQSLMRGVGEVKTPFLIVLLGVVLNFAIDPAFIFGFWIIPPMGVTGAAIATIITQGIAGIIGILLLLTGRYGIHLKLKEMKPDFKLIKKIFYLGFPSSIEQTSRSIGMLLMTFLVSSFGTVALASYGIGTRILSFIIIPSVGFSLAASTLIGQNLGAKKIKRAEKVYKISLMISLLTLTILGVLFFIFATPITEFFIPNDIAVVEETTSFVYIMSLTFGLIGMQMVFNGVLRAAGDTKTPMIIAITWSFVTFIFAYVLSNITSLGYKGIWWSYPLTNIFMVIFTYILFKRIDWKSKKITEEIKIEEKIKEKEIILD